jgi:hypothetical protein
VAESSVHRSMKVAVRAELEREYYHVIEEPLFPPADWISWSRYRPDLLGYRSDRLTQELVLVECETHPNMRRLRTKNFSSISFQPSITKAGSIRRILAVPQGRLHSVDLGLRRHWDIWVIGHSGSVQKMTRLDQGRASS